MRLIIEKEYQLFIKDRSLKVASYVKETIFKNWWNQYALPHLMWALQERSGASVLELQGRYNEQEYIQWIKLYGTKGEEEAGVLRQS